MGQRFPLTVRELYRARVDVIYHAATVDVKGNMVVSNLQYKLEPRIGWPVGKR